MLIKHFRQKELSSRFGACFIKHAFVVSLGVLLIPFGAQASSNTPPACNTGIVVGQPCSNIGQTAMDCQANNVLYCLHLPGQTQGKVGEWYIIGTDTIPLCRGVNVLNYDGEYFRCVALNFPTCPQGQFLTSADGFTVTCVTPNPAIKETPQANLFRPE